MALRRLTGLDTVFLCAETPRSPLNVIGALVLESAGGGPGRDYERIRAQVERRLPALPVLRRRLVEVPFGLDHAVWSDDPGFDLDAHLHRVALPARGGRAALAAFVARSAEQPLRRDRPLWEMNVVEGFQPGRFALVLKIHHAAVDGRGAVALLAGLIDPDPLARAALDRADPSATGAVASPLALLTEATLAAGRRSWRGARQLWRTGDVGARLLYESLAGSAPLSPAPRTRLNRRISSRRSVAMGSVPLADVQRVKTAFATKLNHVVLAACAGALRLYLARHGEVPRQPLIAVVPMAVGEAAEDGMGNAVSMLRVPLPVHLADPIARLEAARDASLEAIRRQVALGALLRDWADLTAPALIQAAARLYDGFGLAERHPPLCNVLISNVRGPDAPLRWAGARILECHPFGPIYDGWALNLTVMSYAGRVDLGAIACPDAIPDVERIPRAFASCVADLLRRSARVGRTARARASAPTPALPLEAPDRPGARL